MLGWNLFFSLSCDCIFSLGMTLFRKFELHIHEWYVRQKAKIRAKINIGHEKEWGCADAKALFFLCPTCSVTVDDEGECAIKWGFRPEIGFSDCSTVLSLVTAIMVNFPKLFPSLTYPVTRPINLGLGFSIAIIIVGFVWVNAITIVNFMAVASEIVPVILPVFNATYPPWYGSFVPRNWWTPIPATCQSSVIKPGERTSLKQAVITLQAVVTNSPSLFRYILLEWIDGNPQSPVDGLSYSGTPFVDCFIYSLFFAQTAPLSTIDQAWHDLLLDANRVIQVLVGCNTTAGQNILLSSSSQIQTVAVSVNSGNKFGDFVAHANTSASLEISDVIVGWALFLRTIFPTMGGIYQTNLLSITSNSLPSGWTIFTPSLEDNNLSSLRLLYNGLNQ